MKSVSALADVRFFAGVCVNIATIQSSKEEMSKSEKNEAGERVEEDQTERDEAEQKPREHGGPKGLEPTRYGDWEKNGRCIDF